MTHGGTPDYSKLADYISGDLSPEDAADAERWLHEHPEEGELIERVRSSWGSVVGSVPSSVDIEAVCNAVTSRIGAPERSSGRGVISSGELSRWLTFGVAATAAVLLAGVSWRILLPHDNDAKQEAYNTYTTQRGQRASVTLSDGSRVTLGPATTLRVNRASDTEKAMVVDVAGEALFHVTHASQRPYTVTSHGVITRVLGTEFVVRAYDPSQVRVAVREGRISVKSPVFSSANAAVVAAGEGVLITPNALPSVSPINDLATDFGWAEGSLVLRNVPLGEALVRLSRWYGIDFQVTDSSLLGSRVYSNFPVVFDQEDIQGLARIIGARVTRSGNTITLTAIK